MGVEFVFTVEGTGASNVSDLHAAGAYRRRRTVMAAWVAMDSTRASFEVPRTTSYRTASRTAGSTAAPTRRASTS